jgi:hypothetical protein
MPGTWIVYDNDVEADAQSGQISSLLQQLSRRAEQPDLFSEVDACGGATELIARAGAHLGDDERVVVAGDYVELACAATIVSQEEPQALRFEKGCRRVFSGAPDLLTIHVRCLIVELPALPHLPQLEAV